MRLPPAMHRPSDSIPPIITNIAIGRGTNLDKSLYSWYHVEQVLNYFRTSPNLFLYHPNIKLFIRYLEKASNNSIRYILKLAHKTLTVTPKKD